jgi:hypothetical protein
MRVGVGQEQSRDISLEVPEVFQGKEDSGLDQTDREINFVDEREGKG